MTDEDDRSPCCPVCGRVFATFRGRRVHQRAAHQEEFHREEAEALSAGVRKARWDQEELNLMAAYEARHYQQRFLNKLIVRDVLPHRSIEAVKGARRAGSYKQHVETLRLAMSSGPPAPTLSSPPPEDSQDPIPSGVPTSSQSPSHPSAEDDIRTKLRLASNALGISVPTCIEEVEDQVNAWLPSTPVAYKPPGLGQPVSLKKKAIKVRAYRRIQRMWQKDRGRAIREVITGIPDGPTPSPSGLKQFWIDLFSRTSPNEPRTPSAIRPTLKVAGPIDEDEVISVVKTTKSSTAPGPDGRKIKDVRRLGVPRLTWAFNSCMLYKDVPQSWADGRTTLIPKKPLASEPGDFRPITITSILLRLFNKVLSRRLMAAAPLPLQQKGFAPEEGVAANILLIQEILKNATSNKTDLSVAFIDFKKAFDSVGHPSLVAATKRWGFPPELTEYIRTLYGKATTNILGDTCPIRRGVLQGDPLSPYLFNITLDWALSQVPESVGARISGTPISYIAYADDVALTASTPCGLQASLDVFAAESAKVGLEIGFPKCATLNICGDGKKKRWLVDAKTTFTAGGAKLKALQPGETYKYLGMEVGVAVNKTAEPRRALAALNKDLGSLQTGPLKPQQKLWALKYVITPRHQYPRVLGKASKGFLEKIDMNIRRFVRKALHLPKDTPNAALYADRSAGGLGVPKFSNLISILKRGAVERLSRSQDPRVARIAEALLSSELSGATAKDLKKGFALATKSSLYASADGRGLQGADESPPTHEWVDDGTRLMTGSSYVHAIRTRLGVASSKLRAARGRPSAPVLCDIGCGRVESLGHILQSCPRLAPERTTRHDKVLGLLANQLKTKGLSVACEPNIRTQAGVRKPDIVVWNNLKSVVLDVQIVADNSSGDFLDQAHRLKREYYDVGDVRAWVSETSGHSPIFSTLTINWRGIMATPSFHTLQDLGLSKGEIRLLIVRSLEGSGMVLRTHRDIGGSGRA